MNIPQLVEEKASELDNAIEMLTTVVGVGFALLMGAMLARLLIRAFFKV